MPFPKLPGSLLAPALAVVLALSALTLLGTTAWERAPRFTELTPLQGTVRVHDVRRGKSVRLTVGTPAGDLTVLPGWCARFIADLRPGDSVSVWIDSAGGTTRRAWRVARGPAPVCTFLQSTTALERFRRTSRGVALGLALAGVACAILTVSSRRRAG